MFIFLQKCGNIELYLLIFRLYSYLNFPVKQIILCVRISVIYEMKPSVAARNPKITFMFMRLQNERKKHISMIFFAVLLTKWSIALLPSSSLRYKLVSIVLGQRTSIWLHWQGTILCWDANQNLLILNMSFGHLCLNWFFFQISCCLAKTHTWSWNML